MRAVWSICLVATVASTRFAVAEPPATLVPGQPLRLRHGQSATIDALTVRLTTKRHPFSRTPEGIEVYPFTEYKLTWRDSSSGKEQERSVSPWTSKVQADLFGKYTFTIGKGAPNTEDEITLTVFAHVCQLRYTSANQLQHPNGKILFIEEEDPCCAYSDGPVRCDLAVKRAQPPRQRGPYCTIYSNQTKTNDANTPCCCRYEGGEPIEPACASACGRLQK